jgi:hypothetical protein
VFIRTVKTAPGATVVQRSGVRRIVEPVGSAHDEFELSVLVQVAHERLHAGQQVLDLGPDARRLVRALRPLRTVTIAIGAHLTAEPLIGTDACAILDRLPPINGPGH